MVDPTAEAQQALLRRDTTVKWHRLGVSALRHLADSVLEALDLPASEARESRASALVNVSISLENIQARLLRNAAELRAAIESAVKT